MGMRYIFSSYTTMSRGVMILLNNNFEQKVKKNVQTDKNGNYIILDIEIKGKDITLANIYGPNEDNLIFLKIW